MPSSADAPLDIGLTLPTWNALPCLLNLIWCKSLIKYFETARD